MVNQKVKYFFTPENCKATDEKLTRSVQGQVLVIYKGYKKEWIPKKTRDPLPYGAVEGGESSNRQKGKFHVGRISEKRSGSGKVTILSDCVLKFYACSEPQPLKEFEMLTVTKKVDKLSDESEKKEEEEERLSQNIEDAQALLSSVASSPLYRAHS